MLPWKIWWFHGVWLAFVSTTLWWPFVWRQRAEGAVQRGLGRVPLPRPFPDVRAPDLREDEIAKGQLLPSAPDGAQFARNCIGNGRDLCHKGHWLRTLVFWPLQTFRDLSGRVLRNVEIQELQLTTLHQRIFLCFGPAGNAQQLCTQQDQAQA